MLSWMPFDRVDPATGKVLVEIDEKKVFSAIVVFIHPSQKLSSIEVAVDMLLVISRIQKVCQQWPSVTCLSEVWESSTPAQ